jgi:hypothetical protein
MINKLVDKFLSWPLPKSVCSDLCVSDSNYKFPRYGTSLLSAEEAKQMLEYVLQENNVSEVNLKKGDLTDEVWREYDFSGRVYRIEEPVELYFRPGGSTHRIVDGKGVVHCVPAPGVNGCVVRWRVKPGKTHVQF